MVTIFCDCQVYKASSLVEMLLQGRGNLSRK
jgi:hypothetical protein